MKDISKNKKIIYAVIAVIILVGIIMTIALKLNFSVKYSDNIRINIHLGKEYNIEDIKAISEEVFATKNIEYQEIEMFKEAVSIVVKDATDEQIENLTNKLKEKYELESTDELIQTNKAGHLRLRQIVNPYIFPIVITTIAVSIYVGIRYIKLGTLKVILTLLLRLIVAEALLLSIIAITRIPINNFLMPVAIGAYLIVTIFTTAEFQNKLEKTNKEE